MATKKIGTVVTQYLRLKNLISEKQKEVDSIKRDAAELEEQIIKDLEDNKTTRLDVSIGSVTLKQTTIGTVKDWPKLYDYIKKKGAFELLEKRLGQSAFRERLEDGVKIPGTEHMIKKSLSVGRKRGL